MRSAEDIKKLIENAGIDTNSAVNETILTGLLEELDKSENADSAALQPDIWRTIMKSRISKLVTAAVIMIAVIIGIKGLSGTAAWANVVRAFNEATDVHIVKTDTSTDGRIMGVNESWIKNQTLFRAQAQDWCVVDDGRKILTLYKEHKIAHVRESLTPYWDYTPLILKVFGDSQVENGITVTQVPEESTGTVHVYQIEFRDYWQGKAWVDARTNLPSRIVGSENEYGGETKKFEIAFDYEPIPNDIFSVDIPRDYTELPRITRSAYRETGEEVLLGTVVDESANPVADAHVFASYAQRGGTDEDGKFSLLVPPTDGSGSIGPSDFPMFVWAVKPGDAYKVAWTIIRLPEGEGSQEGDAVVEETHQGVELVIKNEEELNQSIPGSGGEFFGDVEDDPRVRDIVLVMGPASVVTGRVTNASGAPIANATVSIEEFEMQLGSNRITISELDDEWKAEAFAVTDNDGHYSLNNMPAAWTKIQLKANADGYATGRGEFQNDGQNTVDGCDFQLVEGEPEDTSESETEHLRGRIGGARVASSEEDDEDESEHFEDVQAGGLPVKGGGSSIAEVVPAGLHTDVALYYSFYSDSDPDSVVDISGRGLDGQVDGDQADRPEYAKDDVLGGVMSFEDNGQIVVRDVCLKEFTFSAWVAPSTDDLNNRRIFLLSDGKNCYALQGNTRGGVGVYVGDGIEVNEYNWRFVEKNWTHVTVTHDGQDFAIYRNGQLTEAGAIETQGVTGTLYIGGTDEHNGDHWRGLIDEVAVFNHALTAEEVGQLFGMTGITVESDVEATKSGAGTTAARPAYGGYRRGRASD